jgi:hypothetical protein
MNVAPKPRVGMLRVDGANWKPAFQIESPSFPYTLVTATVRGLSYSQAG